MDRSYKTCPGCGKRALRVATRCPGCGAEYGMAGPSASAPAQVADVARSWRSPRQPTVLIVILAAAGIFVSSRVSRVDHAPDRATGPMPMEVASAGSRVGLLDSEEAEAAPAAAAPALGSIHVLADSTHAQTEVVIARRTVRVRHARSRSAPLEAVILPGDTVATDSLAQGWYRVTYEGEVMGYAEYSALEPTGAARDQEPRSP